MNSLELLRGLAQLASDLDGYKSFADGIKDAEGRRSKALNELLHTQAELAKAQEGIAKARSDAQALILEAKGAAAALAKEAQAKEAAQLAKAAITAEELIAEAFLGVKDLAGRIDDERAALAAIRRDADKARADLSEANSALEALRAKVA